VVSQSLTRRGYYSLHFKGNLVLRLLFTFSSPTDQASLTGAGKASLAETGALFIKSKLQTEFAKLQFPHSHASSVASIATTFEMPQEDASWAQVNGQHVPPSERVKAREAYKRSGCTNLYQFLHSCYLRNDVHSLTIIHFAFRNSFRESSGVDLALEGKYTTGSLSFFSMLVFQQCQRSSTFAPHIIKDPMIRRMLLQATMGGLTACSRFAGNEFFFILFIIPPLPASERGAAVRTFQ